MSADQRGFSRGQTIGHYEVLSAIGRGGMGEVYLAQDRTLQKLGLSPDSLARFFAATAHFQNPRLGPRGAVRPSTNASTLARFDFDVSDAHQLMLRGDFRQEPARLQGAGGLDESRRSESRLAPIEASGPAESEGGGTW